MGVHTNEFGGDEGILIKTIIGEVAMDNSSRAWGVPLDTSKDKSLVGPLGGAGLMREEIESLFKVSALAKHLDEMVVVVNGGGGLRWSSE